MNAHSTFRLPELGTGQAPALVSASACRDWLAAQPLANAAQSQTALLRQINLLNRYAIDAAERLKILELLRDPIAFAQGESARKFSGRPLPLAPVEQAGLDANRSLWQAVQTGYLHCLVACLAGNGDVLPHAALTAQRVISALRAELIDIYRAATDPPASLWRTLHLVYAAAERLGIVGLPVADSLQIEYPASSVAAAYAQTLLLNGARPYELTARQMLRVERWLHRWGSKVSILDVPPAEPKKPPLIVDLAGEQPETCLPAVGGELRWIDLDVLARNLKKRIMRLQKGESPADLKLGDDFPQPGCELLLKHLYQCWFQGGAARAQPRRAANGTCQMVIGVDAIHYYISGKPFTQPGQAAALSKRQADEIATFGRVATRHEEDFSQLHGFTVEAWQVLDESAMGFRLCRPLLQPGGRVGGGQLLAIRAGDAHGFQLAVTRWCRICGGKELQVGLSVLPGVPQAVAVRGTGLSAANEKYRHGFLLPATAAVKEPASIILPAGWFRNARAIELLVDSSRQIRLTKLIERGSDFERAAFDAP
jgi:hypothetical protein